jgi:hypothetical protein
MKYKVQSQLYINLETPKLVTSCLNIEDNMLAIYTAEKAFSHLYQNGNLQSTLKSHKLHSSKTKPPSCASTIAYILYGFEFVYVNACYI